METRAGCPGDIIPWCGQDEHVWCSLLSGTKTKKQTEPWAYVILPFLSLFIHLRKKNAYVWVYMTSLIKFWVWISCPKVHSPPLKKHWHTLCFRSSLNILLIFSYRSPSLRDCLIATGLTIGTGHFQAQWYPLKYGLFFSGLYQRDNLNLCKWF